MINPIMRSDSARYQRPVARKTAAATEVDIGDIIPATKENNASNMPCQTPSETPPHKPKPIANTMAICILRNQTNRKSSTTTFLLLVDKPVLVASIKKQTPQPVSTLQLGNALRRPLAKPAQCLLVMVVQNTKVSQIVKVVM